MFKMENQITNVWLQTAMHNSNKYTHTHTHTRTKSTISLTIKWVESWLIVMQLQGYSNRRKSKLSSKNSIEAVILAAV